MFRDNHEVQAVQVGVFISESWEGVGGARGVFILRVLGGGGRGKDEVCLDTIVWRKLYS